MQPQAKKQKRHQLNFTHARRFSSGAFWKKPHPTPPSYFDNASVPSITVRLWLGKKEGREVSFDQRLKQEVAKRLGILFHWPEYHQEKKIAVQHIRRSACMEGFDIRCFVQM